MGIALSFQIDTISCKEMYTENRAFEAMTAPVSRKINIGYLLAIYINIFKISSTILEYLDTTMSSSRPGESIKLYVFGGP